MSPGEPKWEPWLVASFTKRFDWRIIPSEKVNCRQGQDIAGQRSTHSHDNGSCVIALDELNKVSRFVFCCMSA